MGYTGDVVDGATLLTTWGNQIRDRTAQSFASAAERDAQWPTPPVGALCVLATNPGILYIRSTSAWVPVNPARYGAQAQATNPVGNGAVVTPANWSGTAYGGATISATAGVQLPTAPGLLIVSLYLQSATAPAANQYVRATVLQTPGGFVQTQAFLGLTQTIGTATNVFALDQAGFSYNCQVTHNLGATVNVTTSLAIYKIGP